MRLLDGRRVQLKDLLDEGLLSAGTILEFHRARSGETHRAEVMASGRLRLDDGREFATPSRAAMEAAERSAIDGWTAWTLADTDTSLFALRQTLLQRVSQSASADSAEDEQPSAADARYEMLMTARKAADDGAPTRILVRDLLRLWDANGRGHRLVERLSADLENYSLETRPDFRKVSVDTQVEIIGQASGPDEIETIVGDLMRSRLELEVGLTLGNVPSALGGITYVRPGDTLAKAMTLMRLNDYSQLAVMPSPRRVNGAITWRSIAKALAHNGSASLSDAIEPAIVHPFDRDLVDVLTELYERDFVFVQNSVNDISGVVTAADVVLLYGETATPFFIIGEIDHLLRAFIADQWTVEQVAAICDPEDRRSIESHDDLTLGDYQRTLEAEDRFSSLGWPLDRATFINRLDEVREIRNGVAHFDPDPLGSTTVGTLRNFLYLLRDLRADALR